MWGIAEVDELHEERDVEQDRFGIGEAQGEGLGKIALTGIHIGRRSRLLAMKFACRIFTPDKVGRWRPDSAPG